MSRYRTLGYLPDPEARSICQIALRGLDEPKIQDVSKFVQDKAQFLHLAQRWPPALAIFDPEGDLEWVERVRSLLPRATLVGWIPHGGKDVRFALDLMTAGCDDVLGWREVEVPAAVADRIDRATNLRFASLVEQRLGPLLAAAVQPITQVLVRHTYRQITPAELAKQCAMSVSTLQDQLRRARMSSANRLILWFRLLEDPRRTIENVALNLDFPSRTGLANAFRRYVDASPAEVRRDGGLDLVLDRFVETHSMALERPDAAE